jgi:hypothetical protein
MADVKYRLNDSSVDAMQNVALMHGPLLIVQAVYSEHVPRLLKSC